MGKRFSKSGNRKNSYDVVQCDNTKREGVKKERTFTPAEPAAVVAAQQIQQQSPELRVVQKAEYVVPTVPIPSWINEEHFIDILKDNIDDFDKILKFKALPAMPAGENYSTVMLRIGIDIQMKDKSEQHISYMLKVPHDNEYMKQMLSVANIFDFENQVYDQLLPELEELYKNVGQNIKFAPNLYKFVKKPDCDVVLLEDLRPRGFKNTNRIKCLDMEHTEYVLKRLAQFHAASATRFALKGSYPDQFTSKALNEQAMQFFAGMLNSFKEPFLNHLKTYKNGDVYYQALEHFFANFQSEFVALITDANDFQVLNHGDCWSNNILFKYDSAGHIVDMLFVDFQRPMFSTPAQDLLYFLMTSTKIEIKLKHFDYFIRYYHENLVENLKMLKYPQEIPTLRELHTQLYKYGTHALIASIFTLPAVLLDSTDSAQFENFFGEGNNFKNLLYSNQRYRSYIEEILPWLDDRGWLTSGAAEVQQQLQPAPSQQQSVQKDAVPTVSIPSWINEEHFIDILKENIEDFDKILKFKAIPAMAAGENYATLMLRIGIDIQLKDKSEQHISYMLKVPHDNEHMKQMLSITNMFYYENHTYDVLLPELEELYRNVGQNIKFAPNLYKFVKKPDCDVVLLEDLRPRGFKNANRIECLDMEHTECVLRKLAQFHAASATRAAVKGSYPDNFTYKVFTEQALQFFTGMINSFKTPFLNNLKTYKNGGDYYQKIETVFTNFHSEFEAVMKGVNEFQVLNHGDCWSNNILFKYDSAGHIVDMLFVDFQRPIFSPPAQDLLYFLMTSTKLEIKLKHYDYFIRYYHENLVENLKALQYPEEIPTLRDLHMQLHKYGTHAVVASILTLPIVLLDTTDSAKFENFFEETNDFKTLLYSNQRYRKYIEEILPWLDNRGWLNVGNDATLPNETCKTPAATTAISISTDNINVATTTEYPDWLNEENLDDIIKQQVPDFQQIKNFTVGKATNAGENYSSEVLQIDVDLELKDVTNKNLSYMLKIPLAGETACFFLKLFNSFEREKTFYDFVIPSIEQMYRGAGVEIMFGPKTYEFVKPIPCKDFILMENLRTKGYKNADRLSGLDTRHTESVLKKLAELHAASACCYQSNKLPEIYHKTWHTEANRAALTPMTNTYYGKFLDSVKSFDGFEVYGDKIRTFVEKVRLLSEESEVVDATAFNVLNYCDCWTNNIMFQYDTAGNIVNTYFVDYALARIGSPAYDLYYFLLSSTCLDNKLSKFDYFIRYYHQHLFKNLVLLKYTKPMPTLKELHMDLLKHGFIALTSTVGPMSAALLDPTDQANMDNMLADNKTSPNLSLHSNARYRQHAEMVFKWLDSRGLLDF